MQLWTIIDDYFLRVGTTLANKIVPDKKIDLFDRLDHSTLLRKLDWDLLAEKLLG